MSVDEASPRRLGQPVRRRFHWGRLLFVVILLLALVGAAMLVAWQRRATAVQTAPVTRGDLLVRVLCDGRLEPPEGGELRTADGGMVAALPVHEGDRVTRGQLLLRLSNPDLEARARDASGEVRQLQSDTAGAAGDVDRERREAAYRGEVAAADRRLLAQGAIPRATLDADELAWHQAVDRARAAESHLASLREARPASPEASAGATRLALAESAAADLGRRVTALSVRAPQDGMVYGLPHAAGEAVTPGSLVASVTDPDHPHLRCRVDQPDLPRVAPGQRIIVTFNGLPDRQWDGTVRRVGSGLREAGGREVGEIVGDLTDPVHSLPANAAVDVQVVIAQKRAVLGIPRSALRRDTDNDSGLPSEPTPAPPPPAGAAGGGIDTAPERYVFVVAHGRVRRRAVKVGLIGLSEVEVLDGLRQGERVVTEGPPTLAEDARVVEAKPH